MMVENQTAESVRLSEARSRHADALNTLFGPTTIGQKDVFSEYKPQIDISDLNAVKTSVREVVWSGLQYAIADKEESSRPVSLRESLKVNSEVPNHESVIADFERAVEVVDGKRSNPESLLKVMGYLIDSRQEDANIGHRARMDSLPDQRSILEKVVGLPRHAHPSHVQAVENYHIAEINQIRSVRNAVIDSASEWATGK